MRTVPWWRRFDPLLIVLPILLVIYGLALIHSATCRPDCLHWLPPSSWAVRQALYAVDELCGFIIACALVKPDRSLSSVDARTVRKKMKDKAFARGVHREQLIAGAEELGVDFDDHVVFVRDALVPIAEQLGRSRKWNFSPHGR